MGTNVTIETDWVQAWDAQGCVVSVERQAMAVGVQDLPAKISYRYHYDHSHVNVRADGVLVVQATGEELRLCPENLKAS